MGNLAKTTKEEKALGTTSGTVAAVQPRAKKTNLATDGTATTRQTRYPATQSRTGISLIGYHLPSHKSQKKKKQQKKSSGIDIRMWNVKHPNQDKYKDKSINFSCWDFAGQVRRARPRFLFSRHHRVEAVLLRIVTDHFPPPHSLSRRAGSVLRHPWVLPFHACHLPPHLQPPGVGRGIPDRVLVAVDRLPDRCDRLLIPPTTHPTTHTLFLLAHLSSVFLLQRMHL